MNHKLRVPLHVLAIALIAASLPVVVQAQTGTRDDAVVLQKMKVSADADQEKATGPVIGYRATRSATATKTDTPLNEIPQSITVITADQIKDQNAQTMQEVLRYTAGVRSEMYGFDNRGDWFTMRGGSEGSVLMDGLRVPLTGDFGSMRNEPFAFERIEVLRGPSSVMAGQNGPGGVVNLVSKLPQAEAHREISVQAGNNDHKQIAVDVSGPLNRDNTVLYRVVALGKDSDSQIEWADEIRYYLAPTLTWQPSEALSLTTYLQYQYDETGNTNGFFPVAGTLQPGPNGQYIDSDTFIGEPDWDKYGGKRKRAGYMVEYRVNDNWTLHHNLRHERVDGEMRTMYANWWEGYYAANGISQFAADGVSPNPDLTIDDLNDLTYLRRSWYASDTYGRITNANLLSEHHFQMGASEHTLLVGIEGMKQQNNQDYIDGEATPLNVYDPVYGTFDLPPLNYSAPTSKTTSRQLGVLLQDQIRFAERFIITASVRRDKVENEISTDDEPAGDDTEVSSSLGVVYKADGGFSPYTSYSESFEVLPGRDSRNKAFEPKRGKQVEAGVKWMPDDGQVALSAAAYVLKEKNRETTDADDPDPTDEYSMIQKGEVTIKGVELEVLARMDKLDLIASYSYMPTAEVSESGDPLDPQLHARLNSLPKHMASLWAVRSFSAAGLHGWRAGGGMRYTGETTNGIDTLKVPAYTLFDALVSLDHQSWNYALNVSNLFDEDYVATCLSRGDCWFGSRRKVIGSVTYRF